MKYLLTTHNRLLCVGLKAEHGKVYGVGANVEVSIAFETDKPSAKRLKEVFDLSCKKLDHKHLHFISNSGYEESFGLRNLILQIENHMKQEGLSEASFPLSMTACSGAYSLTRNY